MSSTILATPAQTSAPLSTRRRWVLLATVSCGLLLITLDNSILYTALPTLTRELGADAGQGLWIINAYPLVMAGLLLGAGTLGDRVGHTRMFVIGLVIFGGASVLAAFSPTPSVLIGARGLLAVGAAAMMPATLALIRNTFHEERERNIAIAVWGSISVVGAVLGPILGGLLLEWFWWGSVFLVNVPVVLAALVATALVAPGSRPDPSRRWDFVSSVLASVALVGLVLAIKEVAKAGPSVPVLVVGLVVAVVAGFVFVRRQKRLPHPLLDFALFANPAVLLGVIAAAATLFALAGLELTTSQRFQAVAGFSPLEAGLLVAAIAVGALPTALGGGAVLHRVGLRPLIAGGFALTTVGSVLVLVTIGSGLWIIAGLVLVGAGLGAVMSAASVAIIGGAPAHRAGMASSVEEVSYELGSLIAVAVLGSVFATLSGAGAASGHGGLEGASAASVDGAYAVVVAIIGAVAAVTTVVAWMLTRPRAGAPAPTLQH